MDDYSTYWVTKPIYKKDDAVEVRADNLTVYNIYYQRVKYRMTFETGGWGSKEIDHIDAKWDQDISERFKEITNNAYGTDRGSAP